MLEDGGIDWAGLRRVDPGPLRGLSASGRGMSWSERNGPLIRDGVFGSILFVGRVMNRRT